MTRYEMVKQAVIARPTATAREIVDWIAHHYHFRMKLGTAGGYKSGILYKLEAASNVQANSAEKEVQQ